MTTPVPPPTVLIDDLDPTHHGLFLKSRFLAVDTETLGLNVRRDRLCLVQMCNEDGVVAMVRPRLYQAPRLKEVMEATAVKKLFHYARFDIVALKQWLGIEVNPVYCTKIASRIARTYTSRHGLKDLVSELLGIELNKEQQSSDWAADTLSPQQVAYAAHDVLHLVALHDKLEAMLAREGRADLAHQVMGCLPTRAALDLAGWAEEDLFAHS